MKPEDELLISAYLDDEISQKDREYVEELIKKDNEALELYNQFLRTENQLEVFFSSDSIKEINENLQKKFLRKNYTSVIISSFLKKPWRLALFALAAPLFFIAPVGYFAFNESDLNNPERGVIVKNENELEEDKCSENSKFYNSFVRIFDKDFCKR